MLYTYLFALVAIFLAWYFLRSLRSGGGDGKKYSPSPPALPIIGNLHQLGEFPHISLANLSKKHGGLMLLRLGSKPTLVISSADAAQKILKTHDLAFAARPPANSLKKIFYQQKDLFHLPYGDEWRKLRSIVVQELLAGTRVKSFNSIMEEEVSLLADKIKDDCSSARRVNLTDELTALTSDLISRAAFGKKYSGSEHGRKFLEVMEGTLRLLKFTPGDFIPWLGWINWLNGYNAALDKGAKVIDEVMDAVIEDHFNGTVLQGSSNENFMDILLEVYKGNNPGVSLDLESLKGLILDVFGAGTETSASTLVWAMTELIRHPAAMRQLQNEVREIMREKNSITEHDLQKMPYLKSVIKETLRVHPPVPIYMHMARENVDLIEFTVAPNTLVLINAWAIGRDPAHWTEPEKFKPERFLNSSVDFKGVDFQFIPFGAGRRICPGIGFAVSGLEHTLANLMHKFDWTLPDGAKEEDMDVTERPGFTVAKNTPLIVLVSAHPI